MTYCEQNSVNRPFGQEPQSPVAGSGEDEDGDLDGARSDQGEAEMGRKDRRALGFKALKADADWFAEGREENDWRRVMMSELSLTVCKR